MRERLTARSFDGEITQRTMHAAEARPALAHREVQTIAVVAAVEAAVLLDVRLTAQWGFERNRGRSQNVFLSNVPQRAGKCGGLVSYEIAVSTEHDLISGFPSERAGRQAGVLQNAGG